MSSYKPLVPGECRYIGERPDMRASVYMARPEDQAPQGQHDTARLFANAGNLLRVLRLAERMIWSGTHDGHVIADMRLAIASAEGTITTIPEAIP